MQLRLVFLLFLSFGITLSAPIPSTIRDIFLSAKGIFRSPSKDITHISSDPIEMTGKSTFPKTPSKSAMKSSSKIESTTPRKPKWSFRLWKSNKKPKVDSVGSGNAENVQGSTDLFNNEPRVKANGDIMQPPVDRHVQPKALPSIQSSSKRVTPSEEMKDNSVVETPKSIAERRNRERQAKKGFSSASNST
ncbi:hypothetical protein FRB97_002080 [Tulasnella sp. 331]|nr:hypothetical protein FRB97_002080 [Tulasnella sp. 331]